MSDTLPGLIIVATMEVAAEDRQKLLDGAKILAEKTVKEEGCLWYSFASDAVDPNLIRIAEGWSSEAALHAHLRTAHVQAFIGLVGGLKMEMKGAMQYGVSSQGPVSAPRD